jgi:hypothetical protein
MYTQSDEAIYDRCYRLRNNRGQVAADYFATPPGIIGAVVRGSSGFAWGTNAGDCLTFSAAHNICRARRFRGLHVFCRHIDRCSASHDDANKSHETDAMAKPYRRCKNRRCALSCLKKTNTKMPTQMN